MILLSIVRSIQIGAVLLSLPILLLFSACHFSAAKIQGDIIALVDSLPGIDSENEALIFVNEFKIETSPSTIDFHWVADRRSPAAH